MAILELDIGLGLRAFRLSVALGVEPGETVALVGPSGAGKTSVLRAISGLAEPDSGRIVFAGETWFDADGGVSLPPERRSVGVVFQEYALFPHMTVLENVAFAAPRGRRRERTGELLERFRISHLAEARPLTLSGGERQRVALARALARDPGLLLLDEPLSALDAHTRLVVREELRDLLAELALPAIFISHDFRDAAALAGRAGVITEGQLRQLGPVGDLAERPADPFVAALTGNNLLAGTVVESSGLSDRVDGGGADGGELLVRLDSGESLTVAPADGERRPTAGSRVGVVIAPWEVLLFRDGGEPGSLPPNAIRGEVASPVRSGSRVELRVGQLRCECEPEELARLGMVPGTVAWAVLPPDAIRLVPL